MGDAELTVHVLDVSDDAALDRWYDAYLAGVAHEREFHDGHSREEMAAGFRASQRAVRHTALQVELDGRVVGTAVIGLPQLENTGQAHLGVAVVPDARRRGVASALVQDMVCRAREAGRTQLVGYVAWPHDAPVDATGTAPVEFARAHGFAVDLVDVQRVLSLPVDEALLDRLEAEAALFHRGYTFRSWTGPVPAELWEAYTDLSGSLMSEAPTGENVPDPEVYDEQRLREEEAELVAGGRTKTTVLALSPEGEGVGYTDLVHASTDGDQIFQWGTLVRRGHRGHRLGVALKARCLRTVQRAHPEAPVVRTWNAETNAVMIGVNDRLGFGPVERSAEVLRDLSVS